MAGAKDIILKVIPSNIARKGVARWHYSGKPVQNSSLHFGAFLSGDLHGVLSFGPPLDKRKVLNLVPGTAWNDMLELNRMAFDDVLPRNAESRCLAIAFRLIKKSAPNIAWILSYSDATQCGDGAIYRAAGFLLTGIRENSTNWRYKDYIFSNVGFRTGQKDKQELFRRGVDLRYLNSSKSSDKLFEEFGAEPVPGFQIRYIKLLKPDLKINADILPFSVIDDLGAGMYKGEKISLSERHNTRQ